MKLIQKDVFCSLPQPGMIIYEKSFYTRPAGVEKMRYRSEETKDDLCDCIQRSFSSDNGHTWSDLESLVCVRNTDNGTWRRLYYPAHVDPVTGRLLTMISEGILPNDSPLDGMKQYYLRYQVSEDGGHTYLFDEPVVQKGDYTREHPCDGVWVGRNSFTIGDTTCRPITRRDGKMLVPVDICPIGPDGEYHNPGGGYTYHESAVMIGTWQDNGHIEWDLSSRIANDPEKSTRGCIEPTLAELPDGRILMVLRGSNGGTKDPGYNIPSYRWYTMSSDGGYTWEAVRPWTYTDGSMFYSPGSCSQLLHHSNGGYYWLGNICPHNARGNNPRYPFFIGQVDSASGLLIKDTLLTVDDREHGEHEDTMLSCFMAQEDRETGNILLHMSRLFADGVENWNGVPMLYRIEV